MEKKRQLYTGMVVSNKMEKTVVVETKQSFVHPRFHKIIKRAKRYKVHDPESKASVGDRIEFYQGRPVSKTKHMHLIRVLTEQV